jgi:hypothetical protein
MTSHLFVHRVATPDDRPLAAGLVSPVFTTGCSAPPMRVTFVLVHGA